MKKTVAMKEGQQWYIVPIEARKTPDGILQPPLVMDLGDGLVAKFRKCTKKNNWLYDVVTPNI